MGTLFQLRAKHEQVPLEIKRRQGGHVVEGVRPRQALGLHESHGLSWAGAPWGDGVSRGVEKCGGVFQGLAASPWTLPCP